jgi:hypothetical protein
MKHTLLFISFLLLSISARSQDTLSIMYYNILNYSPSNAANTSNMKGVVNYIKPDIFAVNEISDDTSAKHILLYVLNSDSANHYKKAEFTDGPDTDNMLFYNSDKLTLYSQDTIQTALRLINEYLLYYNNSEYLSLHDTVFFNMYIAHLKASTGSANEQDRYNEVILFKNHLAENPGRKNIFFGGDMNFYSSSEPALTELLSSGTFQMNDPLDSIGNWHDNSSYSHIHTQSTRNRQFGGGATGGLDDRFDFIFVSTDIISGVNQLKYIPGTYEAFGNDGHHFNDSITSLPLNPSIPDSITYHLYNMSDHLPVIMKLYLNYDASIHFNNGPEENYFQIYPNPSSGMMRIMTDKFSSSDLKMELTSSDGRITNTFQFEKGKDINLSKMEDGVYFARISSGDKIFNTKIIIIH